MNVLMVGEGKGSYLVRGRQLGAAIGARVMTDPGMTDIRWADVVVLLKRSARKYAVAVHRAGKPIVWDALDFWAQPDDNGLSAPDSRALLQRWMKAINPTLVIGATEAMAQAAGGVFLPHHAWPGLTPSPARAEVKVVGYQGSKKYLGRWYNAVKAECDQRGWQFVINPPDLRACDLLVAFRDGQWDGWMCREWKSGVKAVNALCAGRPLIAQTSVGVDKVFPTGSQVDAPSQLDRAFEEWSLPSARQRAYEFGVSRVADYSLAVVANRYRTILQGVLKAQAA